MKEEAKQEGDTDDQTQEADAMPNNAPRSMNGPSSPRRAGFSPRSSNRRGSFNRPQNDGEGDDFGPDQPPDNNGFPQPPEGINFPPAPPGAGENGNGFAPPNFPGGMMPPAPPTDNSRNVRTR